MNNERVKKSDYLVFLKRLKEFGYPYIEMNTSYSKNQLIIDAFHRRYLPKLLYKKLTLTSLNKINDLLKKKKNIDLIYLNLIY